MKKLPLLFDTLGIDRQSTQTQALIFAIDALLPQTQCGLCGYKDGCLPYAHAIATNQEAVNLCVPGGDKTAYAISQLTDRPYLPAPPSKWGRHPDGTAKHAIAVIDESACIGCTKCLPACPVDAIIGTGKHMHSVIDTLCTGCELCVAPCPVDCIRLVATERTPLPPSTLKKRYYAHLWRLTEQLKQNRLTLASHTAATLSNQLASKTSVSEDSAKNVLALAKLRTQIKKLEKQLAVRFDPAKARTLAELKQTLKEQSTNDPLSPHSP